MVTAETRKLRRNIREDPHNVPKELPCAHEVHGRAPHSPGPTRRPLPHVSGDSLGLVQGKYQRGSFRQKLDLLR